MDLRGLSDAARAALLARAALVQAWQSVRDAARRRGEPLAEALRRYIRQTREGAASSARVGERSLRRWTARYERRGLAGLLDGRGRSRGDAPGDQHCSPDAWAHFRTLYLDPRRRSVRLCWELAAAEAQRCGWSWPSYATVTRRVRHELPPAVADLHRLGERRWERLHAPRIERDYSAYRPNEHWVGDHHEFDFLVLDGGRPFRPWLTAWQDLRSRVLVGWVIARTPSSVTILAALRAGIRAHGAPLDVTVDNGRDYRCRDLAGGRRLRVQLDEQVVGGVLGQLGVTPHFCRAFSPQSKPVERTFGTICDRFSRLMATYCGNSPDARPESLYADLRCGAVEVPTLESVRRLFEQWVRDVYHRTPHSGDGMAGRCPADVFSENPIARRTAPEALLDRLLMRTARARVGRGGVRYDGVWYGQSEPRLWAMQGREVLLRIDDCDRSRVLVCDLSGAELFWADNQRLRGTSADDVREGARRRRAARALAARALPAAQAARRSTAEHAVSALAERLRRERPGAVAAGTDERPVALIAARGLSGFAVAAAGGEAPAMRPLTGFAVEDEADDDAPPGGLLRIRPNPGGAA